MDRRWSVKRRSYHRLKEKHIAQDKAVLITVYRESRPWTPGGGHLDAHRPRDKRAAPHSGWRRRHPHRPRSSDRRMELLTYARQLRQSQVAPSRSPRDDSSSELKHRKTSRSKSWIRRLLTSRQHGNYEKLIPEIERHQPFTRDENPKRVHYTFCSPRCRLGRGLRKVLHMLRGRRKCEKSTNAGHFHVS